MAPWIQSYVSGCIQTCRRLIKTIDARRAQLWCHTCRKNKIEKIPQKNFILFVKCMQYASVLILVNTVIFFSLFEGGSDMCEITVNGANCTVTHLMCLGRQPFNEPYLKRR